MMRSHTRKGYMSENQFEIPVPAAQHDSVRHYCKDELAAQARANKKASERKRLTLRSVVLMVAVDPAYLTGRCSRCGEVIIKRAAR